MEPFLTDVQKPGALLCVEGWLPWYFPLSWSISEFLSRLRVLCTSFRNKSLLQFAGNPASVSMATRKNFSDWSASCRPCRPQCQGFRSSAHKGKAIRLKVEEGRNFGRIRSDCVALAPLWAAPVRSNAHAQPRCYGCYKAVGLLACLFFQRPSHVALVRFFWIIR